MPASTGDRCESAGVATCPGSGGRFCTYATRPARIVASVSAEKLAESLVAVVRDSHVLPVGIFATESRFGRVLLQMPSNYLSVG
jgi:hypothetical protein